MNKINHCFLYEFYGMDTEKYFYPSFNSLSKFSSSPSVIYVYSVPYDFFIDVELLPPNVLIVYVLPLYRKKNRFNRFYLCDLFISDFYHFRDSDSVLLEREKSLISNFSAFDTDLFIIRDHYLHFAPILAGMFSINNKYKTKFIAALNSYIYTNSLYDDQLFLSDSVYNNCDNTVFSSSHFFDTDNLKVVISKSKDFIGKPVDFNDDFSYPIKNYQFYYFRIFNVFYQRYSFFILNTILSNVFNSFVSLFNFIIKKFK